MVASTTQSVTTALPQRLSLPGVLAGYHIFVSDLRTGTLAELGGSAARVSESIHGLGLSVDGQTLYVSDIAENAVVAYTVSRGTLGSPRRVGVGKSPVHMVQSPDGRTLFVTNFGEASVSVVDVATWTLRATIPVPASPHGITISPDGRWVYAACVNGGAIAVINAATDLAAGTIALPSGAQPYGVVTSRDGRYLYVPDNFAGRLFVIDTTTRHVVGEAPIGLHAALITRSADGGTLYVTNGASGTVSVLDVSHDPAHPTVRATVRVGTYPHGLALTPDGRYLVVANTLGDTLSVIATASETVVATIPGDRYPNDVIAVA
jgi:YVTN family beta-propeller protein